jgi:hypothetical protein
MLIGPLPAIEFNSANLLKPAPANRQMAQDAEDQERWRGGMTWINVRRAEG